TDSAVQDSRLLAYVDPLSTWRAGTITLHGGTLTVASSFTTRGASLVLKADSTLDLATSATINTQNHPSGGAAGGGSGQHHPGGADIRERPAGQPATGHRRRHQFDLPAGQHQHRYADGARSRQHDVQDVRRLLQDRERQLDLDRRQRHARYALDARLD